MRSGSGGGSWVSTNRQPVMMARSCDQKSLRNGRRLIISPVIIADFRALSFADASFSMVVLDPPHLESVGDNAWMGKKYGRLNKDAWRDDSRQRFKEAFRVLRPHGVLIF